MQMCPECGYVYDESEYARCPRCYRSRSMGEVINTYHQVTINKAIPVSKLRKRK